jgi:hypothetical protein
VEVVSLLTACHAVGGEILDLALSRAKPFARFVQCGAISEYNSAKPQGLKVRPSRTKPSPKPFHLLSNSNILTRL